jgi:hypothetical protein
VATLFEMVYEAVVNFEIAIMAVQGCHWEKFDDHMDIAIKTLQHMKEVGKTDTN